MIQQSHLTAWQAHAPWDKRSKIEQDLRLSRAVAAIFSDGILAEHLALRGGTVPHKGHSAPAARYSEDLDLVLIKSMDRSALDARLRAVLAPVLGEPSDSVIADAWLAVRNVWKPSKILRTVYGYVPLGLRYPMTVKVEVNLNERRSLFPFVDVEGTEMRRAEAEQRLADHLKDRGFRADMGQLLRHDFGPYDIDAAAALVRDAFLAHLS